MKKYIIPRINIVMIDNQDSLLQSSYTGFGDKTNQFDAPVRQGLFDNTNYNDDFEE